MANQKPPFDRERLDDEIEELSQIEDPETLAEAPQARLVADLRRSHQVDNADAQSLARVYMRLQAHKQRARASTNASGSALSPLSHSSRKGWNSLKTRTDNLMAAPMRESNRFSRSRLMRSMPVILVLGLLIGAVWTFTGLSSHTSSTSRGGAGQQHMLTGKLLCSASSSGNAPLGIMRPALDWSAGGMLAVAHPKLALFSPQTCASMPMPGQVNSGLPNWSPDGKRLLVLSGNTAQVLDAATGKTLATLLTKPEQSFMQAAWTTDGTQIVTLVHVDFLTRATVTVEAQVWDATTGVLVRTAKSAAGVLLAGAWLSPNGKYLALQYPDFHTEIWDTATATRVSAIASGRIMSVAWSPDGASIAFALTNPGWPKTPANKIEIWSTVTGQHAASFEDRDTFEGDIGALAWSPDGKYLAESSAKINVWDVKAGTRVATFGKIETKTTSSDGKVTMYYEIAALAWAPDSRGLVSVTSSASVPRVSGVTSYTDALNVWQLA